MVCCADEDSWLTARREERLSEFAPPQIYASDSVPPPPQQRSGPTSHASHRPQKHSLHSSRPRQEYDTDSVATMLQFIRSNVEQSDNNCNETAVTGDGRSSSEDHSSSVDLTMRPSCYRAVSSDGVPRTDNFDHQTMASSRTGSSLFQDQVSSTGNIPDTLPTASRTISDASSTVYAASVTLSEAEITTGSIDVCSHSSAPQPAHYSSAPSGPQPKMPKYERIFFHDLPPTLPLPPQAGSSSSQYPSQEEVIGPKRRKEPHELSEKDAIRNWHRQFDQRRMKSAVPTTTEVGLESVNTSQLLKPKNIPFASPYIQTNDASAKVVDDPAAKEFDPTIPPPSAESNSV